MDGVALCVDFKEHAGEEHTPVKATVERPQVVGVGIVGLYAPKHVVPPPTALPEKAVEVAVAQLLEVLQCLLRRHE